MLNREQTNPARFAPDLLADPDIVRGQPPVPRLDRTVSLLAPAVLGGLLSWSWWGALTAFFWAGLVRIGVLHHVTWSVNSICHMIGTVPGRSGTAPPTSGRWPSHMGESWHNLHHADPTCARHGVGRGQIDMSAWIIAVFERLGWAHDVRWPTRRRLARLNVTRRRAQEHS